MKLFLLLNLLLSLLVINKALANSPSHKITTNAAVIHNAPRWLTRPRAERVIRRMQRDLEWSTRRIHVYFHKSNSQFQKQHRFGPLALAITKYRNKTAEVHLGPKVASENFDQVFSHEMIHVIIYQKYKGSIPKWLEEGLANHLSEKKAVNYKVLKTNLAKIDIYQLGHPFRSNTTTNAQTVRLRYMASQAFAEMLDRKCDLENLIRLSVDRKMEDYIKTYCEIKGLNKAFRAWVLSKNK